MTPRRWIIAACVLCLWTGAAAAAPITGLFNTGVNDDGTVRLEDQPELHYTILSGPITPTPFVRTSAGGFPIPPWLGDNTLSAWIAPTSGGSNPPGVYNFRTTFDLTGFDPNTAQISGLWSTDNNGLDILINGMSTGFTTPFSAFSTGFFPFTINTGFVPGINTLDFVVNDGGVIGGLRVQGLSGTAEPLQAEVPEPGTLGLLGVGAVFLLASRNRRRRRSV